MTAMNRGGNPWKRFKKTGKKAIPKPVPPETYDQVCIEFSPVICPYCGGFDTLITHTTRPTRRHICRDCNQVFKSYCKLEGN